MKAIRCAGLFFLSCCAVHPQAVAPSRDTPNTTGPPWTSGRRVAWRSGVVPLGDPMRQNDFPSASAAADGDVWVTWASYSGLREEIHVRRWSAGAWNARFLVPGVSGDVSRPQVAIDSKGRAWIVWSQEVNYGTGNEPNWDLFAARLDSDRWMGPIRLTSEAGPDIHHRLIAGAKGKLWLVWQGSRGGQSDIFLRTCDGETWSETFHVTTNPGNDWYPDVAADARGDAAVVWDSYRGGNYDVFMRAFHNGHWEQEKAVALSGSGEVYASAVFDHDGRLWIAYEEIGANWGKDLAGRLSTLGVKSIGAGIGAERAIRIKVLAKDRWMQPAVQPAVAMSATERNMLQAPRLYCDATGRIWLLYRHMVQVGNNWSYAWPVETNQVPVTRGLKPYWQTYATYYDGDYWVAATQMPGSKDRISSTMSGAPAPNGQFWVAWHTDDRDDNQATVPRNNQVWACVLTPSTAPPPMKLVEGTPDAPAVPAGHTDEPGDVKRLRDHTVTISGRPHHIYRGDLHRHTEFSTDSGGGADGSVPDFFRYMIDAASMDFGAVTDHSAGGDNEYWWWLTQKLTEMHQIPGRYLALFGNERTVTFPNGHRNTVHATRNVPVIKLHFKSTMPEAFNTSEASSRDLVDNDTKLLYTELKRTGGICIPHTPATFWGTDWRDNDPEVEPVVEIFQGLRVSYEHKGAPATEGPDSPPPFPKGFDGHYQPSGYVWNAWAKGYRLGVISSSDHTSTHLSYALVYSAEPTRAGLIEAMRRRHTYAATDNILLEYWIGDHFMGDDFTTDHMPELKVKVRGTAPVSKVSIIRSNRYIGEQKPETADVAFTFRDNSPVNGSSYYYVRVEQADGQMAWSSPIWVTLR